MKTIIVTLVLLISGFVPVQSQTIQGTYAIKNVKTGMLLRIKDASSKNGTPIVAYNPQNWKCMTWDFKSVGGNIYQLENLFSHKTLQPKATAKSGESFEEQPLIKGDAGQEYEFVAVHEDTFLIRLHGTDLYITCGDDAVNSLITMAEKSNGTEQQWKIYKQSPTM